MILVRFLLSFSLVSFRFAGIIAVVSMWGVGCTSLPRLGPPPLRAQAELPRVETTRGELSEKRAEALVERLDKKGESTLLEQQLATMQEITSTPLVAQNSVRLLVDGPVSYRALFKAIAEARDHVNLETFIFQEDELGEQLSLLLLEKQVRGVQVNVLYDSVGSLSTSRAFFDRLSEGGVRVCEFNPIVPTRFWRIGNPNHRDHRKQAIIDGRLAITGGINLSSVYSSGSSIGRDKDPGEVSLTSGWRDTNVELEGPAVAEFQKLFMDTWQKQGCEPLVGHDYLPKLESAGDKVVSVLASSVDDELGLNYLALLSAIRSARQRIYITNAYFVPDTEIVAALTAAARRGVDVKLVLQGLSDLWMVRYAGRASYTDLLSAGVKIYELEGALLHAKTAVVDGVWSTVGSTNLDWRSFIHNDELNTVVLGEDFGRAMTEMFEADLKDSTRVDFEVWKRRSLITRVKERIARLFAYWL